jgi:uncharacterized membrane protein YfcA
MELLNIFPILIAGLMVGMISTIFGIGGGILMVPLLTAITPLSQVEAMATSLTTVVLITSWNTWRYHRQGLVIWKVAGLVVMGSAICSAIAAYIATFLPEKLLVGFMLSFLLFLAWKTFGIEEIKAGREPAGPAAAFGIGALCGTIAGLVGIGGGSITTPLLLVSGLVKNRTAAPTSNAIMVCTAGAAALTYAFRGPFAWPHLGLIQLQYSLLLAAGALTSSFIGIRINSRIKLSHRRSILGLILLLISLRLAVQLLTG